MAGLSFQVIAACLLPLLLASIALNVMLWFTALDLIRRNARLWDATALRTTRLKDAIGEANTSGWQLSLMARELAIQNAWYQQRVDSFHYHDAKRASALEASRASVRSLQRLVASLAERVHRR